MGYYLRAFCIDPRPPRLSDVQAWLRDRGSAAQLDEPNHAVDQARRNEPVAPLLDLDSPDWEQVAVTYKRGKLPILAECNQDDGTEDCLLHEELTEFTELVEEIGASPEKQRVLEHLRNTKVIIACQLPTSDIEDDGYSANVEFLSYFVERCGAMIQADGEGFYEGTKVILPLGGAA